MSLAVFEQTLQDYSANLSPSLEYKSGAITHLRDLYQRLSEEEKPKAVELIKFDDQLMVQVADQKPWRPFGEIPPERHEEHLSLSLFS